MAMQDANRARLQRRRDDRIFFGVCGGLGAYFGLDPLYFRLAFVLAVLADGAGILVYLIMAIVMPAADAATLDARTTLRQNLTDLRAEAGQFTHDLGVGSSADDGASHHPARSGRDVAAAVLIVLGVLFLAANLGWLRWFDFGVLWPLALVLLGVALLWRHRQAG